MLSFSVVKCLYSKTDTYPLPRIQGKIQSIHFGSRICFISFAPQYLYPVHIPIAHYTMAILVTEVLEYSCFVINLWIHSCYSFTWKKSCFYYLIWQTSSSFENGLLDSESLILLALFIQAAIFFIPI